MVQGVFVVIRRERLAAQILRRAVLQGLGQVLGLDVRGAVQVGDGPGHPADAVIAAGGKPHAVEGPFHQGGARRVQGAVLRQLRRAHVGIAMGGVGSDIAIEAADIALVNDEISELPHLLRLSRRMMGTIKLNLTFSMTLSFAAIVLAMTGLLGPVVGALVHNAGSVLVIINSAFLLRWRKRGA